MLKNYFICQNYYKFTQFSLKLSESFDSDLKLYFPMMKVLGLMEFCFRKFGTGKFHHGFTFPQFLQVDFCKKISVSGAKLYTRLISGYLGTNWHKIVFTYPYL